MEKERKQAKRDVQNDSRGLDECPQAFPPGHFYSPVVSINEFEREKARIYAEKNGEGGPLPGVDLNEKGQLRLLKELSQYCKDIPFPEEKSSEFRYYFENNFFSYGDAVFLYSFLRKYRPKNIIEIGSGFSSALMLDTNERFFDKSIRLTFIEPNPERLYSLIKDDDHTHTVIVDQVQHVDSAVFSQLNAGDILYIDSSHVSKIGSDVNYELFQILPKLKKGVFIHFHDIFFPFELPEPWVLEGRCWTETYMLRAFLSYNSAFEIKMWPNFLSIRYAGLLFELFPLAKKKIGASIWIKKTK